MPVHVDCVREWEAAGPTRGVTEEDNWTVGERSWTHKVCGNHKKATATRKNVTFSHPKYSNVRLFLMFMSRNHASHFLAKVALGLKFLGSLNRLYTPTKVTFLSASQGHHYLDGLSLICAGEMVKLSHRLHNTLISHAMSERKGGKTLGTYRDMNLLNNFSVHASIILYKRDNFLPASNIHRLPATVIN